MLLAVDPLAPLMRLVTVEKGEGAAPDEEAEEDDEKETKKQKQKEEGV